MADSPTDQVTRLYEALVADDRSAAITAIEAARASGAGQAELFDTLFAPAVALLGGAWARGEIDEYAFARASAAADQVVSFVTAPPAAQDSGVTVVIGVVRGDGHTSAKNIVTSALKESGHRVVDLGDDVPVTDFAERAAESGALIIIACAEQVATARSVADVRELLRESGRDDVALLVCGGPFTADEGLARSVGANGVVPGAERGVALVERLSREFGGTRGAA